MGNRAVITTKAREVGLYLHWNGGRDTVCFCQAIDEHSGMHELNTLAAMP